MSAVSNNEAILVGTGDRVPESVEASGVTGGRLAALETTLVDPLSSPRWDSLAASHPGFSFFHSSAWARVLSKTYAHRPFYIHLSEGIRTIAVIPMMEVQSFLTGRRGVCLPFTDFCDPLVFDRPGKAAIVETLVALGRERKWKHFEVRGSLGEHPEPKPSVEFLGHTLALAVGTKKLFEGFASPVRRAIRKAERSGAAVRITRTHQGILDFYRLHAQTRKQHGVPPQPLSFFLNIYEEIIKPGAGFVILATTKGIPVAGAVFFHQAKKAIYKFGASIRDGQEIRANNLVIWEGIKFLTEGGFETLHLGRTSLMNQGLRRFKLGWGAMEEPIKYFRLDPVARKWKANRDTSAGFHNSVFARLPLSLSRIAGTVIYPHLD